SSARRARTQRTGAGARARLWGLLLGALMRRRYIGRHRFCGRLLACRRILPPGRQVGDLVALDVRQRLMGLQPAVARAGQRRVRAATSVGEDRGATALDLLLLIAVLGLLGGELALRADVHTPAGQARGQARVLA